MIRTALHRTAAASHSLVVLALAVYALVAARVVVAQESASRALFDLEAARSVADEFPSVVPSGPVIPAAQASYQEPASFDELPPRGPISNQQLMQAGLELTDRFDEYPPETDERDDAEQDWGPEDTAPRSRNSLKGFLLGCIGCLGTLLALKWLGVSFTSTAASTSDEASAAAPDLAADQTGAAAPAASSAGETTGSSPAPVPPPAPISLSTPAVSPVSLPPPLPRRRRRGRKRAQPTTPQQVVPVHAGWPTQLTVASAFPIASPMPVPVPMAVPQAMAPIGYLPYPNQPHYPPQGYAPPPPQAQHYPPANSVAPTQPDYSQTPAVHPAHGPSAPYPMPTPAQQPAHQQPAQYQQHAQQQPHTAQQQHVPQHSAPPQFASQQPTTPQIAYRSSDPHLQSAHPSVSQHSASQQSAPHPVAAPQAAPRQHAGPSQVTSPQAVSYQVASSVDSSPTSPPTSPTLTVLLRSASESRSTNPPMSGSVDNDRPVSSSSIPAAMYAEVASPSTATCDEHSPRAAAESPARRSGDLFARILEENRQVRVALDVAEL